MKIVFRNVYSGCSFVIDDRGEAGKQALERMEALPSWLRS